MKEIPGYPGYFVSEDGQIISKKTGRVLKPRRLPAGYHRVSLCVDGKPKDSYIHRLVAQSFIPNPESKPCVNHINGNKADNRVENLEWCTYGENQQHAIDTGLLSCRGEAHSNSKLTEDAVREIRQNAQGLSQAALGKLYGVSAAMVNRVRARKAWKHVV